MSQGIKIAATLGLVAALAAVGGYWFGMRGHLQNVPSAAQAGAPQATPQAAPQSPVKAGPGERKIRFYRNPMGLPDTSTTPKKDSMGMDYIPVYEGEDEDSPGNPGQIRISTEKIQKLGVRSERATMRSLDKTVRAAGRVEADERRSFSIAPKFEGYVERLYVNATGQPVARGQVLFEAYSPELVLAQREYAIAADGVGSLKAAGGEAGKGMQQLADSALARLKNWDVSEEQVKALARTGEVRRTLSFRSPVNGIVVEKKALQGMRFMPGEALFQVTDLSAVWVIAEVFEQDISQVRPGARARVRIGAYPDKVFEAAITYVYPTLTAATRTIPVRLELANPGGLLKPGMYAQVELPVGTARPVLTVPLSAVIDTGTRQIVLIQLQEGRFEAREVKAGSRSENDVEILQGLREGEQVVVSANFLIDAESNLKAAIAGFSKAPQPAPAPPVGHQATGKVDAIDLKAGTATISHGPVASLKWPAMTMDFKPANEALLKSLKVGQGIAFEFVERGPGEWILTAARPAAAP